MCPKKVGKRNTNNKVTEISGNDKTKNTIDYKFITFPAILEDNTPIFLFFRGYSSKYCFLQDVRPPVIFSNISRTPDLNKKHYEVKYYGRNSENKSIYI
jgi:hypothetical protein